MDKRRNDEKAEKAILLYGEGFSLAEIAKKLGGTRQSIHGLLRGRGYSPRKKREAEAQYFNGRKYTKRANGYFLATTTPRTLIHRDIWIFNNGYIPENYDIHHKDFNRANNKIENLELLSKQEHARRFSTGSNQYIKKEREWHGSA